MGTRVNAALAVLNGVIGDGLARSGNELATPMSWVHGGEPLTLESDVMARALSEPSPRVVVLVHGLMCTESVWRFRAERGDREARDYGTMLAADLGYTPLYIRYNSGLPIADNGAALAGLLAELVDASPVAIDEIVVIAHSLGGLVTRSACRQAAGRRSRWLPLLRRVVFIDTPHLGSPLERLGRSVVGVLRGVNDPYAELVAEVGDLRSAAIKDLGDGDALPGDRRAPLTLPDGVEHHFVAADTSSNRRLVGAVGNLLVPVSSATAHGAGAASVVRIFPGIGHRELARHPEVYDQIRAWCEEA